jgi:hypothetical protein
MVLLDSVGADPLNSAFLLRAAQFPSWFAEHVDPHAGAGGGGGGGEGHGTDDADDEMDDGMAALTRAGNSQEAGFQVRESVGGRWNPHPSSRTPLRSLSPTQLSTELLRPHSLTHPLAVDSIVDEKGANRTLGISGGRSPTWPFRDARRFPWTRL